MLIEAFGYLFARGIASGELRPDIPVRVVVQMLAGSLFARHLSGYPEDDAWLESLVSTLLQGLSARP